MKSSLPQGNQTQIKGSQAIKHCYVCSRMMQLGVGWLAEKGWQIKNKKKKDAVSTKDHG